jgi:hypothetical protein
MEDQNTELKRHGIWGFVSVVAIIVIGFLLFTGCQQAHEYNMECIKRGGTLIDTRCFNANPN